MSADYETWAASLKLPHGAFIENGFVIYRDQGYTPVEWAVYVRSRDPVRLFREPPPPKVPRVLVSDEERRLRKNAINREWTARRRMDPEYREAEKLRERVRMRRVRTRGREYIVTYASLHGLGCSGPTRATGCRCRKVSLYRRTG